MDKGTDKLRDHVCDKGGRGSKNSKFSRTSLMEAPSGNKLTDLEKRIRFEEKYL